MRAIRLAGTPADDIFPVVMSSTILSISPIAQFSFSGRLPGDPAIAQTALLRTALAAGQSSLTNLPEHDRGTELLAAALETLGCALHRSPRAIVLIPPEDGLHAPAEDLDLGDAAYPLRLMIGLLAAQPFRSRLRAAHPLNKRNIERVLEPLRSIGAELTSSDRGTPPVFVFPATIATGQSTALPIPNAWVKGALLATARSAGVALTVSEPTPSRDYPERILEAEIVSGDIYTVHVPTAPITPLNWALPSDSILADHVTGIGIVGSGSPVAIEGRLATPLDLQLLDLLQSLGARIDLAPETATLPSMPTARLSASSAPLKGCLDLDLRTLAGFDAEIPLLAVLVGCGGGELVVRGAMNMRQQICDRISALVDNLLLFGIDTEEFDDGFRVTATGRVHGGAELSAYDDPVIAAAMMVLCSLADAPSLLFDVPAEPRALALASILGDTVRMLTEEEIEHGTGERG